MSEPTQDQLDAEATTLFQALRNSSPSRRGFLFGAGGLAVAGVAAACSSSSKSGTSSDTGSSSSAASSSGSSSGASSDTSGSSSTTAAPTSPQDQVKIATFAASLELLAAKTYGTALDAANAGKLGTVPPAVATFVQTAQAQHQAAADALNMLVTSNGGTAATAGPADVTKSVNDAFAKVTDVTGAAKLALMLEGVASATYQKYIPMLNIKEAVLGAGQNQILAMQHQAILNFVLGNYPVPDTFGKTDNAAKPA